MRVAIGGQLSCVGPNGLTIEGLCEVWTIPHLTVYSGGLDPRDMTSGPRNASYAAASECYNFDARIINCEALPQRLCLSGSGSAW
jgi:hypothetical protein